MLILHEIPIKDGQGSNHEKKIRILKKNRTKLPIEIERFKPQFVYTNSQQEEQGIHGTWFTQQSMDRMRKMSVILGCMYEEEGKGLVGNQNK